MSGGGWGDACGHREILKKKAHLLRDTPYRPAGREGQKKRIKKEKRKMGGSSIDAKLKGPPEEGGNREGSRRAVLRENQYPKPKYVVNLRISENDNPTEGSIQWTLLGGAGMTRRHLGGQRKVNRGLLSSERRACTEKCIQSKPLGQDKKNRAAGWGRYLGTKTTAKTTRLDPITKKRKS